MRNTRAQRTTKKILKTAGSGILLAMLFVLVFAGTLSGAFGIEENLQQNGIIQSNVADAATTPVTWNCNNNGSNISSISNIYERIEFVENDTDSNKDYWAYYSGSATLKAKSASQDDHGIETTWQVSFGGSMYTAIKNVAISSMDFKIKYEGDYVAFNGRPYQSISVYNDNTELAFTEGDGESTITATVTDVGKDTGSAIVYTIKWRAYRKGSTSNIGATLKSAWVDIFTNDDAKPSASYNSIDNKLTVQDATAGVKKVEESINGGAYTDVTSSCTFENNTQKATYSPTAVGLHTVKVTDNVGNISDEYSYYIFSGSGTSSSNPFLLRNRTEFDWLSKYVNGGNSYPDKYFKVEPESGTTIDMGSAYFEPIGDSTNKFKGHINGNNSTIANLNISSGDYSGLFGYVEGGSITNLTLTNATVAGRAYVGGLVGYADSATISGCSVSSGNIGTGGKISGDKNGYTIVRRDGYVPNSGESFDNLNDGDVSTKFYTSKNTASFIIQVTDTSVPITGFAIANADDTEGQTGRKPTQILIWGSNSNSTTGDAIKSGNAGATPDANSGWVGVYANVGYDMPVTNYYRKAFAFPAVAQYTYYWVHITSTSNMQLSEFELLTTSFTGGLIGCEKESTISNCSNNASVGGTSYVGGIAGCAGNTSASAEGGSMTNVSNSGAISSGLGTYVGGIAGYSRDAGYYGAISNRNAISASTSSQVGGLWGYLFGNTKQSGSTYTNSGNVTGGDSTGGIAGKAHWATIDGATNSATIIGNDNVGGIVGLFYKDSSGSNNTLSGTLTNGGYTSGRDYVGGIIGKIDTSNLETSFSWTANVTNAGSESTLSEGDGVRGRGYVGGAIGYMGSNVTISGSITISNGNNGSAGDIDGYYTDVDADVRSSYAMGGIIGYNAGTISATMTVYARVLARGSGTVNDITGAFVGGIVGYNAGTISGSATKASGDVLDVAKAGYAGGHTAYNGGTISGGFTHSIQGASDASYKVIDGGNYVGGVVGYNAGTLSVGSFTNVSTVSGKNYVGGIVGYISNSGMTLSGFSNSGDITSSGTSGVGGIVGGMANGITLTIKECSNSGDITATSGNGVAGIIGYTGTADNTLTVSKCYNTGDVSAKQNAGGIGGRIETTGTKSGNNPKLKFANCYNTGDITVTGEKNSSGNYVGGTVGGILGYLYVNNSSASQGTAILQYCYNSGKIYANNYVGYIGGIIGNPRAVNSGKDSVEVSYCYNEGLCTEEKHAYTDKNDNTTKYKTLYTYEISGSDNATVDDYNIAIGSAIDTEKDTTEFADIYNLTGVTSETKASGLTYGGKIFAYGKDLTVEPQVNLQDTQNKKWTDILTQNIDGFKVYGTTSDGTYMSSLHNDSGTFANANTAVPNEVDNGGKNANAKNQAGYNNCALTVTYKYNAKYGKNLLVEIKDIAQDSKTREYCASSAKLLKPTVPYISENGYSYLTLYYSNSDFSDNSTEYKIDIGSYYTITDIVIEGKVVGRKTNTLTITAYDFESHFENGEVWFGFNKDAVVSNQDLYTIDGTSYSLYLLNDAENENPHVLVYANGNYYKIENVVIYYTAYWYWSEGTIQANTNDVNPTTSINICNYTYITVEDGKIVTRYNYTLPNFTTELNSGEHVRDGVQITASGENNFTGSISRYYTLLDSDFGGNVNQANWGSVSNPYVIENQAQLMRLSQIVNGAPAWNSINTSTASVCLAQNSNAVATDRTYDNSYFVIKNNLAVDSTFEPIGGVVNDDYNGYTFKAESIKGYNNTTVNITYAYNNESRDYVGLFGKTRGVTIENIVAKSESTVKGKSFVGGLVGFAQESTITDCSFISLTTGIGVEGIGDVGGLVGRSGATKIVYNKSTATGSHLVDASVNGVNNVGGIVGSWDMYNSNEYNNGNNLYFVNTRATSVTGTGNYVGGLVGYMYVQSTVYVPSLSLDAYLYIGNTTGSVTVNGKNYVGALFGALIGNGATTTTLNVNGYNVYATVNGTSGGNAIGGLVGMIEKASVVFETSYNTSSKKLTTNYNGSNLAGGLIGVVGEGADVRGQGTQNGNTTTYPTITNGSAVSGGNIVGGIIGYVAHTAGSAFASSSTGTTTSFGASVWFVNGANVSGTAFVGGIVGAIGGIDYATGIDELNNLLLYGNRTATSAVANTMVFEPSVARNSAKVSSSGSGSKGGTGGILGYSGANVRVNLVGATISSSTSNINSYTFNIQNTGAIEGNFAGGIVGYLGDGSHTLQYLVNYGNVGKSGASNVGGIVGYMIGGEIANCVSAPNGSSSSIDTSLSQYLGASNVGGLVGFMQGGTLRESISGGFNFASTTITKGGVVGGVVNPIIEGAWAIYFATDPTYQSVSQNTNGKYVLIDSSVLDTNSVAQLKHIFVMAGIIATGESGYTYNNYVFKQGQMLVGVNYPSAKTKQLAFYDVSGSDSVMDTPLILFSQSGTLVQVGVDMFEGESFSICKVDVRFGTISKYTGGNGTDGNGTAQGKTNAEKGYQAPSGAEYEENSTGYYYTIDVTTAKYDTDGNISEIHANIYFNGTLVGATTTTFTNKVVGSYENTFVAGSEASPYVISTQEEWNDFAYSIYSGAKDYSGQYVKLNTNVTIEKKDSHQGTGNVTYNFYQNEWNLIYDSSVNGGFTIGDANNTDYTTTVNSSTAYKYYWVYMEGGSGGLQLSKFKINGGMSYTVMASKSADNSGSEKFQNIFSDNTNKYYNARNDASFSVKYDSAVALSNFTITNANDNTNSSGTVLNRTVTKIMIWGTNNGVNVSGSGSHAVESATTAGFGDDGKSAGSNMGYNLAGNIEQGDSTLNASATIVGVVTPSFKGHFDGNGHTITIEFSESVHRASVFPNASNATFKNLTIDGNVNATGKSYRDSDGNVAITNDMALHNVAGYDIAGFVGKPFGAINFENCVNNANIIGLRNVAGIIGYNAGGNAIAVTSCVNTGDVISLQGTYTLAGFTDKYKYNDGLTATGIGIDNIGFTFGTGGIIGAYTGNITIESCRNAGDIYGGHNVGGIIGWHEGVSSTNKSTILVNNCANTGNILANSGYWHEDEGKIGGEASQGVRQLIFGYAGGLIGLTGQYSILEMYASYNTGDVTTYSNMVGGLVGSVGAMYQTSGNKNSVATGGRSTIAYCYNVGTVRSGGTFPKRTENYPGTGREMYGGSIAGGLVGLVGNVQISQCYNAGDVWQFGLVAYLGSWQMRVGGIVGQSEPSSGMYVLIDNTYNIGTIYVRSINTVVGLGDGLYSVYKNGRYAAAISAYCDVDTKTSRIKVSQCYSINNCISSKIAKDISGDNEYEAYLNGTNDWFEEKFDQWYQSTGVLGIGDSNPIYLETGRVYDTYDALTAAMSAQSSLSMTGENFAFGQSATVLNLDYFNVENYTSLDEQIVDKNANVTDEAVSNLSDMGWKAFPDSWLYVYGCVPQLAVFALDTYNGLSMRSINYGKDIYGEYKQQNAGEKYSPYVIKDGIDLMALQALVDAGYSFDNEYIEFADETNNLDNVVAKYINLATYSGSTYATSSGDMFKSGSALGTYDQVGKSYHLFTKGAIFNRARTKDAGYVGTDYTNWKSSNYYLNGTTGNMTSGATFANMNFLPIGGKTMTNAFKGNISGALQSESGESLGNVEILNTTIRNKQVAGLFGWVEDATISNITTSGSIESYAYGNNSYVGGIVGTARGASVIEGCNAGSTQNKLTVTAYANNKTYSDSAVASVNTGAGGIVGMANTLINGTSYKYEEGTRLYVGSNTVVNAQIESVKNNVGGIVGLVSGYKDGATTAKNKSNRVEVALNNVNNATIKVLDNTTATRTDVGTNVGGVIGSSDEYITTIARNNVVGIDSTTVSVNIYGENSVGGIIGSTPDAVNEIVGGTVNKSTLIQRKAYGSEVTNAGDSGTAIGGIVGRTAEGSGEQPITTTLSGKIDFKGNITVAVQTAYSASGGDDKDGAVLNIGGIVGDMGAGARIATGAEINVSGNIAISASTDSTHFNRNIGGVAGRSSDVAFSGTFDVKPTMNTSASYNVGGFIGKNNGIVDILADDTDITIGGTIQGTHDVGGFIGHNAPGQTLRIGADYYRGVSYSADLEITIATGATITASGDNVGGIVGNNAIEDTRENNLSYGHIEITKGNIENNGNVTGANSVGGIIGINSGALSTGGSAFEGASLSITNNGNVTGRKTQSNGQYTSGMYVGGVIGKLNQGTIAGNFANTGYVSGSYFVGGSIGYVDYEATITAIGSDTSFTNGIVATSSGDALIADDNAIASSQTHNVEGVNYVGGSLGYVAGTIQGAKSGDTTYKVIFTSNGTFDGQKYVGGSIGVLAGVSQYAEFISSADAVTSANTAVGGSVGFIGMPSGIYSQEKNNLPKDYVIKVTDTHFEAGGILTVNGNAPSGASDWTWGGVGGAIGAIGNSTDNNFSGGDKWADNTYYAGGNVSAKNLAYVGGIVGLIKANNIEINNMLAYDTTVTGYNYVGGIVGATCGANTVIDSAYSISTSDTTGMFTATVAKGTAGGIIGLAQTSTNASTSYWVKGYSNEQLASSNVGNLQNTLGRFTLVSESFINESGSTVNVVFTKELIGDGSALSNEENSAIYPTPYDYYESVGKHSVNGVGYSISADDAGYTIIEKSLSWNEYFTMTRGANVVKFSDIADNWVIERENWTGYSTGTSQTGWYFVYANDTTAGTVNVVHASSGAATDKDFWKRIANAYTAQERATGKDETTLSSQIVQDTSKSGVVSGGSPTEGVLYATATGASASGYYMYIATSNKDVKPSAIHSTETNGGKVIDKFFINVNTNAKSQTIDGAQVSAQAQNVAVYYRSIAMGSSLTYNGYERYAPISLQSDITYDSAISDGSTDTNKKNQYYYKTSNTAKAPGTYTSDVDVFYFDDAGKAYVVGGIDGGTWKINKRKLSFASTSVTNKTYGDEDISITLTVTNISPADTSIDFDLTISGDKLTTITVNLVNGKAGGVAEYTNQNVKVSGIAVTQNNSLSLSGADARFNVSTEQGLVTNKLTFVISFKDAKEYKVALNTTNKNPSVNYAWEDKNETTVSVKPATLTIKSSGTTSVQFDNKTHGIAWSVEGFKFEENLNSIVSLTPQIHVDINSDKNYTESLINSGAWVQSKEIKTTSADNNRVSTVKVEVNTSSGTSNNTIQLTGAILKGEYYLTFAKSADNCNYTFDTSESVAISPKLSIGENKLTVSWASTADKTYDKKTTSLVATVTADKQIENIEQFVKDYFNATVTDSGNIAYSVTTDGKVVQVTFTTGVNAMKYTATLNYSGNISGVECAYEGTLTKDVTIKPRAITITEEWTENGDSNHEYTYTSYHQGLSKITVAGVLSGDSISISLSGALSTSKNIGNDVLFSKKNTDKSGTVDTNALVGNDCYSAKLHLNASNYPSKNYKLDDITYTWKINPVSLDISISGTSTVTYDATSHKPTVSIGGETVNNNAYRFGQDTVSVNYRAGSTTTQAFVNAGTYSVSIDNNTPIKATRGTQDVSANYSASASGNATYTIEQRQVTIVWSAIPKGGFVYSAGEQGLSVQQLKFEGTNGKSVNASSNGTFAGYGNDKLVVTVSGKQVKVGTGYTMQYESHALSESVENEGEKSTKDNYIFNGNPTSDGFDIIKSKLAITYKSGSISKVYDATTEVSSLSGVSFDVTSTNFGADAPSSYFNVTATYGDRHVGDNKEVKFTYALKSEYTENYAYEPTSNIEQKNIGRITAKEITVYLNKLRSGKATRTYNGDVYYGGEKGASTSTSKSATYRNGEGFTVDGWFKVDDASIIAKYVETGKDRSQFDSYVNNVYVDGGVYKNDGTFYKKLQFVLVGNNANNYTFKVCNTSGDKYSQTIGTSSIAVDIFDSRDTANNEDQLIKDIQIEITVKSIRVTYTNTTQSYVNDDNTYNTDWKDVIGENRETDKAGAEIEVVNGWKSKEGGYKSYTVIRGSATSTQLGAKIKGGSGMEFNFRLSNQPILTIGYFVNSDNDEMQISSLADLLIASFYWTASQKAGDSDFDNFMKIIQSGYEWVSVATQAQYDNAIDVPSGYDTWDAYFSYVENRDDVSIFFNDDTSINAWGYYKANESSSGQIFTSYKQIADIDGTITQRDIELLGSFFTSVEIDGEGNTITKQHEWGLGKTYLDNIINPGVGNVAVAIGSIFKSKDSGFTGSYDGNGYVIEYFNIMSFDSGANVGMFDVIGATGEVKNLHLRNFTISAGGANSNVGGIAGSAVNGGDGTVNTNVENVTWHGTISMTADGNVGGLFGYASKNVSNAITLGTITAKGGNIGSLIGSIESATVANTVSFVYVEASGNVSATFGKATSASVGALTYLANSAWKRANGSLTSSLGSYGTAKTYTQLMEGSTSGYASGSEYYLASGAGTYDVIDETDLSDIANLSAINARQSMRLKDIIDVYMLMFDLEQATATVGTQTAKVYKISSTSWLVGTHHGTDSDRIVIANKQNVSLLRELRFASFVLVADVEAQSTSSNSAYGGAFFGNVTVEDGNDYVIDFGTSTSVFEAIVQENAPFEVANA